MNIKEALHEKLNKLQDYLKGLEKVIICFSGGVDSAFLMKVAHDVLGENAVGVTVRASSFPEREMKEAREYCQAEGIRHYFCEFDEMKVDGFRNNPPNRCYICKRALFQNIRQLADELGICHIAEGSNLDDNGDYRPGMQAIAEAGVKSPLRYAQMTKQDIRMLARELGVPSWSKPSAACLASRFAYGEEITRKKLAMVERGEQMLLDLGFRQMRVRIHGKMARIEVAPEDISRVVSDSIRETILTEFEKVGFSYVSLDLKGYRTGSMNEVLTDGEKQKISR